MIKTKRERNKNYRLMDGDKQVGEAWKLRGKPGFGVKLTGFYWRNGLPNTCGGSTATSVSRLMDVAPLAQRTLTPNQPSRKP